MSAGTTAIPERAARVLRERYELFDLLGQGAMGLVYRARDRELDRIVAIKTIDPACAGAESGGVGRRLQHEATAAARLTHPGIVTVYDVGLGDGTPYIVMEYFKGRTLAELVAAGPLPPARAVHVVLQVCRALQYAHAEGVLHRDIKSSNIMVDDAWRVKLADFGVARVSDRDATQAGRVVGTPAYMAPEQARGGQADARSDLFSLGVVLYEALTGCRPFPSDDLATALDEVINLDPVPARERNFAVSPALDAVVRRALSKEPDERYPDAAALADALGQALEPAPTVWASVRHAAGRHRGTVATVLVALGAATTATWLVVGSEGGDARRRATAPAPPAPVVVERAVAPAPTVPAPPPAPARALAEPATLACVSVNAVPYAVVYVDGRRMAETPRACLWLTAGRHRVVFESETERSPEQVIVVEPEHTAADPLRVSYDFRARQFLAR